MRRIVGSCITLVALAAIALATLRNGDPATLEPHGPFCLVCGNQGSVDVIQNLLLFAPLGAGLALLGLRLPVAVAVAAAVSLSVESIQATLLIGRAATLSDLLTNTTGATLAYVVVRDYARWLLPTSAASPWLASAWLATWAAVCLIGAWGLLPMELPSSGGPWRVMEIPPGSGHLREFEGTVLHARIGNVEVSRGPAPADGALGTALESPAISASATVIPMEYAPGKLRPIVSVHDSSWTGVLLLGQRYRDLSYSTLLNARKLRLRNPSVRLQNVFPGTTERGERRRAEISLLAERTPSELLLQSSSAVESRQLRVAVTPLLGWTMLAPFDLKDSPRTEWMTLIWLAVFLVPAGYWAAGAMLAGRLSGSLAASIVAGALAVPWVAAVASGLSLPGLVWLPLAAGCVAAGAVTATFVVRFLSPPSLSGPRG